MEDFIQILIWLFIIISLFSSFFKKKPEQQKPGSVKQRHQQFPQESQSASTEDDDYDILNEIETLFNPDLTKTRPTERPTGIDSQRSASETIPTASEHLSTEQQRSESEYVSYEKAERMDRSRSKLETELSSTEHTFSTWQKPEVRSVDSKSLKKAEAFEQYLQKRTTAGQNFAAVIRNRLKNPSSIKEYIIMSEIINMPGNR